MAPAVHDLGIGLRCIKYLLVAFNFLFALSGILLVLTSMMVSGAVAELMPLLDRAFLSPGLLLGVAGAAVIVVAFFGIWGAVRQSSALVSLFSFLMSLLLILELAAGMSAFMLQDDLHHVLSNNIAAAMHRYDADPETRRAIDTMQRELRCCGIDGASSWMERPGFSDGRLPASCCAQFIGQDESECRVDAISDQVPGCLTELGFLITRGSAFIASTAVVTAFTQFLGILFACTLGRSIRQQKTLRDMRRQQLRSNLINSYSPIDTKHMPPITIAY